MFVSHGGGPMPLMGDPLNASLASFLRKLPAKLRQQPKALLVISGHWEEKQPTVTTSAQPPMLYDYYGFPPETYQIQYPAPGSPDLAERVTNLLRKAGLPSKTDAKRGFDHGTFVPLKLMFPKADIPVVTLSLVDSLDPKLHTNIGAALSPLRDEGVLILGSGSSYHNMSGFRLGMQGGTSNSAAQHSKDFHSFLDQACVERFGEERSNMLAGWAQAPGGRESHPREEHLIPLMVVAGAAGNDRGTTIFNDKMLGLQVAAYAFGDL